MKVEESLQENNIVNYQHFSLLFRKEMRTYFLKRSNAEKNQWQFLAAKLIA